MAAEVYEVRLWIKYLSGRQSTSFYFRIDNTTGDGPFQTAAKLCSALDLTSGWLFAFRQLISEQSYVLLMTCRRIRPTTGPLRQVKFLSVENPGNWPGPTDVNYQTCDLMWTFPGDVTGKHQVRVGPLGAGAIQGETWFGVFRSAVAVFAGRHTSPILLAGGLVAEGCINHQTTGGTLITNAQMRWPPGRQLNRRWIP